MSIKIYKDVSANSIFIEDANGAQFLNSLQASVPLDKVTISDLARGIEIISNSLHTEFIDENDNPYTGTAIEVSNTLNSIFSSSGTPTGELPNITSTLTINSVEGDIINYELTANYGVGYEWDLSSVAGITTVEGNPRKLIGGSSLSAGTYNIPVKAINYNGEDSETIVLTVSNSTFPNTKSVQFEQGYWLGANASTLQNVLGRSGNGSGNSDAWTISFYFKAGSSNRQEQTIFYYGSNDVANGNHFKVHWNGNESTRQQLVFRYGTNSDNLLFKSPVGSLSNDGNWHHYMITYNGGTTGASIGSISDYYDRFKMFIDGVEQTTINSNSNYGITTALNGVNLRVGRYDSTGHMRNSCKIDELAIWDSDESANISSIYNNGIPLDLSSLTSDPVHWWRMGDGDTYPYLFDTGSAANCTYTMYSMTSSSIVNDVPN